MAVKKGFFETWTYNKKIELKPSNLMDIYQQLNQCIEKKMLDCLNPC